MIFYHHKLEEIGDTDIMNATCASLPPDVFAMSGDGGTETSDLLTPNKSTTSARSSGRSISGRNSPKSAGLLNAKRIEAANVIVRKNAELESLTKLQTTKVQMELKNAQETNFKDVEDQI